MRPLYKFPARETHYQLQEQTAFIRETKTLMQSMYRLLARQVRLSEEQLRISEQIDSKLSALIKRQSSAMHCELSEPSTCDGGQECGDGVSASNVVLENVATTLIAPSFISSVMKREN